MINPTKCFVKYGHPDKLKNIVLWNVPVELQKGKIPKRIYCNADIIPHLTQAFKNLIDRGFIDELKTWDGCHNIRPMRGYEEKYKAAMAAGDTVKAITYLSIHSWGGAVDVNAADNGLGKVPKLSAGFVKCFTDAGFDWGGIWQRKDGMHFQLSGI